LLILEEPGEEFLFHHQRSREVKQVSLKRCDTKWKKNGATTLPSPKCNLPLWVVVFYVIENILKHFDLDIEIIF